jgi:hypothetical protein
MAKYDPTHPALCLKGKVINLQPIRTYDDVDNSGLTSQDIAYEFELSEISPQAIADESTRRKGIYNGIDVKAGDWISDNKGEVILQIESVIEKKSS